MNGDGDLDDSVFLTYNLYSGRITNLAVSLQVRRFRLSGSTVMLEVWEGGQRQDLNGDGDMADTILHTHNTQSSLTTNLGVPVQRSTIRDGNGLFVTPEGQTGTDLNGDGDALDLAVRALMVDEDNPVGSGLETLSANGKRGRCRSLSVLRWKSPSMRALPDRLRLAISCGCGPVSLDGQSH